MNLKLIIINIIISFNGSLAIFYRQTELFQFDQKLERFLRDHFKNGFDFDLKKNCCLDLSKTLYDDILILKETDKNVCFYSSISKFLNCFGGNETIACEVKSRLDTLNKTSVKLKNLEMKEENNILKLVEKGSNFTMVNPENNAQVLVTIKNEDNFSEPGILIDSDECWSNLLYFLVRFEKVYFRLNIFL